MTGQLHDVNSGNHRTFLLYKKDGLESTGQGVNKNSGKPWDLLGLLSTGKLGDRPATSWNSEKPWDWAVIEGKKQNIEGHESVYIEETE
jgi:hypothetical protein